MKKFALIIVLALSMEAQASGDFLMALGALHALTNLGSVANGGESRPFVLPQTEERDYRRDPYDRYPRLRDTSVTCTTTGPDYHRTTTCH